MREFGIVLVVLFAALVDGKQNTLSRLKTDPLSKTRCDLFCYEADKVEKTSCRAKCRSGEVKPGTCPSSDSPQWAAACVKACTSDPHCDGTQRCCHHGCGSTCSEPTDLLTIPGLPAVPVMAEVKEKRHSTIIRWSDGVGDLARTVTGRVLYLLQEQNHLGPKYEEARLGSWNLLMRTNKTKLSLRNLLKPGRWYRFRVASVSIDGTRGYSDPSIAFTMRRGPRAPLPPRRLKVKPLRSDNGTITVRLEWREPRSDLPVLRYKVFWSRRARGLGGELDSVLVNHQSVPKEQSYYDIKGLQPNSMYFLQVQTISQFGTAKLKSEKAAIFYNTTNDNGYLEAEPLNKRSKRIKNLKLQKIIWLNKRIKARISWDPVTRNGHAQKRYVVKWRKTSCDKDKNHSKKELSATTEETTFEVYELDYNCSYKVNVNRYLGRTKQVTDSELMINVPGCVYFQRKVNGSEFKCQ